MRRTIHGDRVPFKQMLTIGLLPSFLKILIYKIRGAKIGRNVSIGFGSIVNAEKIEIGDKTSISFGTFIRGREIKIGKRVQICALCAIDVEKLHIDDDAILREQVYIGGPSLPESYLKLGKRSFVSPMSCINPTKPIIAGDDTAIGGDLFTHGSWQSQLDGYPNIYAPITLGNNVWLAWRVLVLPGVTLKDNTTIGACSLVTKDLPPGCLAAGIPAKVIRTADQHPRKVSKEEKDQMIRFYLQEFTRFVSYHGFVIKLNKEEPYWETEVKWTHPKIFFKKFLKYKLIYNPGVNIPLSQITDNRFKTCYVSLTPITEGMRTSLSSANFMWIDLANKFRSNNSNDVGEEFVLFLRRFGLYFDR